ncbi:MAG TPA: metallophosphoesterase [Terriglobales bacterium]|nr:metallophosphoesterase [Terriglobales bacterium]
MRIAAVGDLHCSKNNLEYLRAMFAHVSGEADVLLLCGDLVDHGLADEARILTREIASVVRIPIVAVLGNHDFEAGQQGQIASLLDEIGVHVLDGDSCEIAGVGFAGVKGFAGGFGPRALGPWGEDAIKAFVHEAVNEALKLEGALARLKGTQRVVVLHYAPIAATVAGESPEIYPFLGSSRLEEPINRYPVAAVFHGHAHAGVVEGRTSTGVPVYNVAAPLLMRTYPERPPFRIVEVDAEVPVDGFAGETANAS